MHACLRVTTAQRFNLSKIDSCFTIVRIVTIHIYYNNLITGENTYSKLSLVDLAGSEGLIAEDDSSERVTDLLHVMKSHSAYVTITYLIFVNLVSFGFQQGCL